MADRPGPDVTAEPLAHWIDTQYRRAAAGMLASISRTDLEKKRPGFGQQLRAVKGSIVASPVLASYDPDPDYFFHWFRDSAIVVDALRLLHKDGNFGNDPRTHFGDFVRFSLALRGLDGRGSAAAPGWRTRVEPGFMQYVRSEEELAAVHDSAVSAEARVNPDGTLDISRWSRPQHDGPPLRALAVARWLGGVSLDPGARALASELLRSDLGFTLAHGSQPGYDIWEEELGEHYYTLRISEAALREGAAWIDTQGESPAASACRSAAGTIRSRLDTFWREDAGHYRSRMPGRDVRSSKELDISVILAAIHAGGAGMAHSVDDPRMHATLARLESLFDTEYPINHGRGPHRGTAMGRYAADVYFSGGAYYFSTLGAAEFCYRAAAGGDKTRWIERGDAFLETVRTFTPPGGEMSEQFDQRTGAQTSARHLAWSYAAFLSCVAARRAVIAGRS